MKRTLLVLALGSTLFACGEKEAVSETPATQANATPATVEAAAPETKIEAAAVENADATKADDKFANEIDKVSYSAGVNIIGPFANSLPKYAELGYTFNNDMVVKGIQDALAGQVQLTDDEMRQVITAFHQKVQAKQQEQQAKLSVEQMEKGKTYLDDNKKKDGVKITESGLQYRVLTQGDGAVPTDKDTVEVHYKGTLTDGTVFDSSYDRGAPVKFPVNGVIKGWVEALQLMPVGSKYELTIPAELGYGERGTPTIPPNSVLVFEVELLSIVKPAEAKTAAH